VTRTHGHQTLAHVTARTHPHPKTIARVLVHEGPIRAAQHAAFGLGHLSRVSGAIRAGVENHFARIRGELSRKTVQQGGFA
jgi:hypothetical protein